MRIYLSTTKNNEVVPYNHIPSIVGRLHKWLGVNTLHDEISLYSFSWLKGGKKASRGLYFPNGAEWFISTYDINLVKTLVEGIQNDPIINFGLKIKEVSIKEDPKFNGSESFSVASPVFIKRKINESIKHFVYSDLESDMFLTETLQTKLRKAGLSSENVKVSFERNYHSAQTKLINYNGIFNKASVCPIKIDGSSEQIAFAWNVGVGNSTGIGFGALN